MVKSSSAIFNVADKNRHNEYSLLQLIRSYWLNYDTNQTAKMKPEILDFLQVFIGCRTTLAKRKHVP